ncbi:MAG: hypothetical protein ACC647_04970 [Anaerolineales bacterium]
MFDDLRDSPEEDPISNAGFAYESEPAGPEFRIFGMTAGQRLIISLMLLATVFILGLSCTLVTTKIWPF